jgi:hypothetical protein
MPIFTPEWLQPPQIAVITNNIRPWFYKKVENTSIEKNLALLRGVVLY